MGADYEEGFVDFVCSEFSQKIVEVMSVSNGFLPSEDSSTVFTELKESFPVYDTEKLKTVELMEGSHGVVKVIGES